MEAQSLIMGVILVALSIFFVLWPLFSVTREERENDAGVLASSRDVLMEQRDAIYLTIRDLDFEFETGKLSEDIYQSQRNMWVERGVEVLRAVDQLKQKFSDAGVSIEAAGLSPTSVTNDVDAQIEAAIAARRRNS
jgi:hypothetical protein